MTRHLRPVEPPRGPRRLESRKAIEEWASERNRTLMAMLEADRAREHDEQLEFDERVA